jgi:sugar phosphate permease
MGFMTLTAFLHVPFEIYVVAYLCVTFSQGITAGNMQVMGSDLAPVKARGQFISIWRFIAETGTQLSPTVFAVVSALFSYVGSFAVVGFSSLSVALLVGLGIRETVGRERLGETLKTESEPASGPEEKAPAVPV